MRLARDPRWRTVLVVDPDRDVAARFWPSRRLVPRLPQGQGDLGRRMQRLFERLPPGPAIIVGSDIPAIAPHTLPMLSSCSAAPTPCLVRRPTAATG